MARKVAQAKLYCAFVQVWLMAGDTDVSDKAWSMHSEVRACMVPATLKQRPDFSIGSGMRPCWQPHSLPCSELPAAVKPALQQQKLIASTLCTLSHCSTCVKPDCFTLSVPLLLQTSGACG